jgi:hypothetical protein
MDVAFWVLLSGDVCVWGTLRTGALLLRHFVRYTAVGKYSTNKNEKVIPLQARTGPEVSRRLRFPRFQDNRNMKVVRLSALSTGRLNLQEIFLALFSVKN